jgi:hypothetical protein
VQLAPVGEPHPARNIGGRELVILLQVIQDAIGGKEGGGSDQERKQAHQNRPIMR